MSDWFKGFIANSILVGGVAAIFAAHDSSFLWRVCAWILFWILVSMRDALRGYWRLR